MQTGLNDVEGIETLLNKTEDVFLKENTYLKTGQLEEYKKVLEVKKQLVRELDSALQTIILARESKESTPKSVIRSLQDRIMKLLMIDRENEQLLMRSSAGNFVSSDIRSTTATLNRMSKNI
jgi:hypothetical protein